VDDGRFAFAARLPCELGGEAGPKGGDMNDVRVDRMLRELHTYPMPAWIGVVAGLGSDGLGIHLNGLLCALALALSGLAFTLPPG
jgi:hypothetical protein